MTLKTDTIATSAGPLAITPIHHATFVLGWGAETVHVDPVGSPERYAGLPAPTLIVYTHHHSDHLDLATLEALAGAGTDLVAPPMVAEQLPPELAARTTVMANGESATVRGVPIAAVPMYNTSPDRTRFHKKGEGNGYVMTFGDVRLYNASDTEETPEMREQADIDIAFLPMNLPYTMTPDQVAAAIAGFKPRIVYPFHYKGTDPQELVDRVPAESGTEIRVRDWYAVD